MKARVGLAVLAVAAIVVAASCTIPVADLGGAWAEAYGVNDSGVVVGVAQLPGSLTTHAFKRTADNTAVDLGTLPGDVDSVARDVNDAGTVVGWSLGQGQRVVVWDATNQIDDLGFTGMPFDINQSGVFVGNELPIPGRFTGGAFVYDPAVGHPVALPEPPGTSQSSAWGINDTGKAVGSISFPSGSSSIPVLWDLEAHTVTDLRPVVGSGYVTDIADDGTLIGSGIWKPGQPPITLPGLAVDVNDAGTVVGYTTNPGSPGSPIDAFRWTADAGVVLLGTAGESSKAYAISGNGAIVGIAGSVSSGNIVDPQAVLLSPRA